jgi:hypothetical protein
MLTNAFIGRLKPPTSADLAAALGPAQQIWDRLLREVSAACGIDGQEWNSYSPKAGWALRLQRKGRNILYLAPGKGAFLASLALGDRALAAARQSKLPARVLKTLNEAKRYAEGTAVRLDVASAKDLDAVKQLAIAKTEN